MSIGTTVIELREFKEKKKRNNMDKMGKICLALIGRGSGILVIHRHVLYCIVIRRLETESKN